MAGLYIHVPFCQSRCIYCDFYSTTGQQAKAEAYIAALQREMRQRKAEAAGQSIDTLYVGGGTPSSLPIRLLGAMLRSACESYTLSAGAEVTVEANPDDVSEEWLAGLSATPANRISMGVQTFDDGLLRMLHRRHNGQQAREAVQRCKEAGYANLSIDLIYGLPGQTLEAWERDVRSALSLGVTHLSAYALSYEEGTPLWHMLAEGQVTEADEELSLAMYHRLIELTAEAGWQHYEISNFCLPGYHSRHNSSYWSGLPYLGFGPAAHSYDGDRLRRWNTPHLDEYIASDEPPHSCERLTDDELYDEYVMTRLRTREGLDLSQLAPERRTYCLEMARPHLESGKLNIKEGKLCLSETGIFVSNDIISDLMH